MAIPALFLIPAGASAVYGLVKGAKAVKDHLDANEVNEFSQDIVEKARRKIDVSRETTNDIISRYGKRKANSFEGAIKIFIDSFGKLKNVDLVHSQALDRLTSGESPEVTLRDLRRDYYMVIDTSWGLGSGAAGGAALAFGAYNGTMLLATASTGTAISSLSGAAATNATLAWLGGGSIASGGGGIALGTTVLGAVAFGPAFGIFGHIMGNKAEAALNNARANQEEAEKFSKEAGLVCEKLEAIGEVANTLDELLSKTATKLRRASRKLEEVIDNKGVDYSAFNEEERAITFTAVKYAQLIKLLIDTPILDEAGNLLPSAKEKAEGIAGQLQA